MKYQLNYKLELTEAEAITLKKALGKQSDTDRTSYGIDSDGKQFLHDLYDHLPYGEDE